MTRHHEHSNGSFNDNPTGKNIASKFLLYMMYDAMTYNKLLILE